MSGPQSVVVPVEPTEAMIEAAWDRCDGFVQRPDITRVYQAMLTAAPVREEGGAVELMAEVERLRAAFDGAVSLSWQRFSEARDLRAALTWALAEINGETNYATDDQRQNAFDKASDALATREEAPACKTCEGRGEVGGSVGTDSGYQNDPCPDCREEAPAECQHEAYEVDSAGQPVRCSDCDEAPAEAGEPEGLRMAYKTGYQEGVEDSDGNFCRDACEEGWGQYLEALRAQPQAREEAQPVAWRWKPDADTMREEGSGGWRLSGHEVRVGRGRGTFAIVEVQPLYTTPPAPEAGERDYPAEFEAWWATYRHRNRDVVDYSVKKQIAFDAFYHAALRARSSAPEAREGEPVGVVYSLKADLNTAELPDGTLLYTHPAHPSADHAELTRLAEAAGEEALGNLLAVIHGDGGHRALEVGTKQAALEAEKIVAGLFAAPSADKLRGLVGASEDILSALSALSVAGKPIASLDTKLRDAINTLVPALAALQQEGR